VLQVNQTKEKVKTTTMLIRRLAPIVRPAATRTMASKGDIIDKIHNDVDLTKSKVKEVVDKLLEHVSNEIAMGGSVTMTGFGTFSRGTIKARTGRNPKTGEQLFLPEVYRCTFKPGATLKKTLNP
jgi:DNA-binding protein HU-beta